MVCWETIALGIPELTLKMAPKKPQNLNLKGIKNQKMGSKSNQNASIFTRKMMVGSKNIFFNFLPPKNQFFKDFIAQKITFLKKDASPRFWVKAF